MMTIVIQQSSIPAIFHFILTIVTILPVPKYFILWYILCNNSKLVNYRQKSRNELENMPFKKKFKSLIHLFKKYFSVASLM